MSRYMCFSMFEVLGALSSCSDFSFSFIIQLMLQCISSASVYPRKFLFLLKVIFFTWTTRNIGCLTRNTCTM